MEVEDDLFCLLVKVEEEANKTASVLLPFVNELGGEVAADGSGRSPYLDILGNVCGTPGMITRSKSDPTADSKTGDGEEGREEGKEAALDLLSSAVFLFKTSRRKLI